MNQEILFATHNRGKLAEARNYLSPLGYLVYGLDDLFLSEEVVEDGKSYEDNAYKKAKAFESLPFPVFSDDSGLEVEALGGKPGLFTARFASEKGGYKEAMAALAQATEGNPRARYVCTICLLEKGQKKPLFFTGVCEGEILKEPVGDHGFGKALCENGRAGCGGPEHADDGRGIPRRAGRAEGKERGSELHPGSVKRRILLGAHAVRCLRPSDQHELRR